MRWRRVVFALGLVLVAVLFHRVGFSVVLRNVAALRWGFAAVLGVEGLSLLLSTLGWRATLSRRANVPFRSLVAARIAGDSINSVLPTAVVGGEVVRAKLLIGSIPASQALASVGLAAMAQFVAQVLFVAVGSVLLPATVDAAKGHRGAGGVAAATLVVLGCLIRAKSSGRETRGRHDFARSRWIRRLTGGPLLGDVRRELARAMREGKRGVAAAILFFFGGWLVTILEVSLILSLLRSPVPLRTSASIAVLMVLVEGAFFFVPARAGVTEAGLYAIFSLLGLQPAQGFSLAIVRRVRELVMALVGLTILLKWRSRAASIARPPAEQAEACARF